MRETLKSFNTTTLLSYEDVDLLKKPTSDMCCSSVISLGSRAGEYASSVDILSIQDLLISVLSHLPTWQLIRCQLVCRSWQETITRFSEPWRHIHFQDWNSADRKSCQVPASALRSILSHFPESLDLSLCPKVSWGVLSEHLAALSSPCGTNGPLQDGRLKHLTLSAPMRLAEVESMERDLSTGFLPGCKVYITFQVADNQMFMATELSKVIELMRPRPGGVVTSRMILRGAIFLNRFVRALLEELTVNTTITELDLSGNGTVMGTADLCMLADVLLTKNRTLRIVNVLMNDLQTKGRESMRAVLQASALCTSCTVTSVCGLQPNQTHVELNGMRLRSEDAALLSSELSLSKSITSLNLTSNRIGAMGLRALAELVCPVAATKSALNAGDSFILSSHARLEVLKLGRNRVCGDTEDQSLEGFSALAEAISHSTSLRHLDLACNEMGRQGAMVLARGIKASCSLHTLNLSDNDLRAKGFRSIVEALRPRGRPSFWAILPSCFSIRQPEEVHQECPQSSHSSSPRPTWFKRKMQGGQTQCEQDSAGLVGGGGGAGGGQSDRLCRAGSETLGSLMYSSVRNLHLDRCAAVCRQDSSMEEDTSGVRMLASLLRTNSILLTTLSLQGNMMGPNAIAILAAGLQRNRTLHTVNLTNNFMGAHIKGPPGTTGKPALRGVKALARALKVNSTLTSVNVLGNKLQRKAVCLLLAAAKLRRPDLTLCGLTPQLRSLDIFRIRPQHEHLEALNNQWEAVLLAADLELGVALHPEFILNMHMSGTQRVSPTQGISIPVGAILSNSELTRLDLSGKMMNAECAIILGTCLAKNTSLRIVNLRGNHSGMFTLGAEALGRGIGENRGVTKLDLSDNALRPRNMACLMKALASNHHLETLILASNWMGGVAGEDNPEACDALAQCLRRNQNSGLTHLDLTGNYIGPLGAAALAKGLGSAESLTKLVLKDNRIGGFVQSADEVSGFFALSLSVVTKEKLQHLDLSGNNMGPNGLALFVWPFLKRVEASKLWRDYSRNGKPLPTQPQLLNKKHFGWNSQFGSRNGFKRQFLRIYDPGWESNWVLHTLTLDNNAIIRPANSQIQQVSKCQMCGVEALSHLLQSESSPKYISLQGTKIDADAAERLAKGIAPFHDPLFSNSSSRGKPAEASTSYPEQPVQVEDTASRVSPFGPFESFESQWTTLVSERESAVVVDRAPRESCASSASFGHSEALCNSELSVSRHTEAAHIAERSSPKTTQRDEHASFFGVVGLNVLRNPELGTEGVAILVNAFCRSRTRSICGIFSEPEPGRILRLNGLGLESFDVKLVAAELSAKQDIDKIREIHLHGNHIFDNEHENLRKLFPHHVCIMF